jgi:hypothetical protein
MEGVSYGGYRYNHNPAGKWTVENFSKHRSHPEYDKWLANLKPGFKFREVTDEDVNLVNKSYPTLKACDKADDIADARLDEESDEFRKC